MRVQHVGLLIGGVAVIALLIAGAVWIHHGFSARDEPSAIETLVARGVRKLSVPTSAVHAANPVPLTPEVLAEARAHFADHCATCHANDGSGMTEIGQNLYPKAPDMRLPDTQKLTDGELYYIIRNGIRLTGMPAWGPAEGEDEDSWTLVHFIRHLPRLTPDEIRQMERFNPKSAADLEEEQDEQRFLNGEPPAIGHERMNMKTPPHERPKR